MIRDEAQKLVDRFQEAFSAAGCPVQAAVEPIHYQVEFHAPGGGRPRIFRYKIKLSGEASQCLLDLDDAEVLLDSLPEPPELSSPESFFAALAAGGMAVEPLPVAELPE